MPSEILTAKTPAEKRAMAERLEDVAPEVLEDLKMFSDAFGPLKAIRLEIDYDDEREDAEPERAGKTG